MSFRESAYQPTATHAEARTLFAHTMSLVAITAAFFAGGAYLGRDLSRGAGILWLIAAFACLIGIRFAVARSEQLSVGLLFGFGVLIGLAVAPTIAFYAKTDPQAVWEAGGSTALFIAGFGAAGYATRRDLSALARVLFFALIGLILFGIVLIFVTSRRRSDLRDPRARDLRRLHDVRLPALAEDDRHQGRAAPRRLDLPRHPQRLPPPALHLRQALRPPGSSP